MWTLEDFVIDITSMPNPELPWQAVTSAAYVKTFRTDFSQPGFCVVLLPAHATSAELRSQMVELKRRLGELHRARRGDGLCYRSMGRFNQQLTTKFHLDGAPEESLLMLGYEPTSVRSRISLADYSRAAHEQGLSPLGFLERYNPMFAKGEEMLTPYFTELPPSVFNQPFILLINNSFAPFKQGSDRMLGVLHKAAIAEAMPEIDRIVNSTMIEVCCANCPDAVSPEEQAEFATIAPIRGSSQL